MAQESFQFPTSFAQQRLWFLDQIMPGTAIYNMSGVTVYSFAINADILKKSINEIVRRHETLRTTFKVVDGQPFQLVVDALDVELPVYDLMHLSPVQRGSRVQQLLQLNAVQPFNLEKGPLIRTSLIKRDHHDYLFLLSMHHIISDAWSINIFFKELYLFYEAFAVGKPSPLPELPIQYADYSVWQREYLSGPVLEQQMAYWKKELEDVTPLNLPLDFPRPAFQSFKGIQHYFEVPQDTTEGIRRLSQQHNATIFMTLLASFTTLLYRYSAQEDIIIGVPVAGRNQTELEQLIGFFVNAIVIRTRLSAKGSFIDLLQQVRQKSLDAFSHGDLPFEKLVEELHPERDLSRNPLFQVLFQMNASKEGSAGNPTTEGADLNAQAHISKFDLTLSMSEEAGGLKGYIEYNTDLFLPQSIERMVGHFLTLLHSIVQAPTKPLWQLDLLPAAERQQLLQGFNPSARQYAEQPWVHQLIDQQAQQQPDQLALFTDKEQWSYGALEKRSNQLAHYLMDKGLGVEQLVAVALDRSPQMVAVHLAILKAGAAFVPLDVAYPQERLSFMLQDLQASLLITEAHLVAQLPPSETAVVLLSEVWPQAEALPTTAPEVGLLVQHRCYVMYTSGSTGKPKGVELQHGGFLNLVHWNREAYELTGKDRSLQMATPAYDAYIYELFPALAAGASVYLIDDVGRTSPEELRRKIIEQKLSVCCLPTALSEALLQEPWEQKGSLRLIGTAGDKLSLLPDQKPPFRFLNLYGPTENTVIASFAPVHFDGSGPPPIGRPVANVELYVLDPYLNPVPVGITGELYIGGKSLARGYLHRARLTAEKFIPDPFSSASGARLYRTGDLVRFRSDGNLEFVGRTDHQVKLRGFRIELEEIERGLLAHPEVREAVVVLQQNQGGSGGKALVAYVALQPDSTLEIQGLRSWLKEQLPQFMVPSQVVVLGELPKSFNGKIDRKALQKLQEVQEGSLQATAVDSGALTPLEKSLVTVWSEFLPGGSITVERNFFDMGAHSLMMAQVQHRLRTVIGQEVPLVDLFQYSSIRSLCQYLESKNGAIQKDIQGEVRKYGEVKKEEIAKQDVKTS